MQQLKSNLSSKFVNHSPSQIVLEEAQKRKDIFEALQRQRQDKAKELAEKDKLP